MASSKGQIWSTDFIAAVLALTFILLLFFLLWNGINIRWHNSIDYWQMQAAAVFASEALVSTPGDPGTWEQLDDIEDSYAIGLVNGRNELNERKIIRLVSENDTSYRFVKERLGVQRYELGIRITDMGRETSYHEFGKFAGPMDTTVLLERVGLLNETPVMVQVEVWR